jgi:hypothetical protein
MGLRIVKMPFAGNAAARLGGAAARETMVNRSRGVYSASRDRLAGHGSPIGSILSKGDVDPQGPR